MRKFMLIGTAAAAIAAAPGLALAQDTATDATAGPTIGADVGATVGGPAEAAAGAGVSGTVGAGARETDGARAEERVGIEQRGPDLRERSCITDVAGAAVCEELRR
jgi:hypothetical protein